MENKYKSIRRSFSTTTKLKTSIPRLLNVVKNFTIKYV